MGRRLNSIAELTEDLGFTTKEKRDIEKTIENKSISRSLTVLRVKGGLTQTELAQKIGTSQSFVSKMENAKNEQINFNDVGKYLFPLGYEVSMNISKPKTLAQQIIRSYNHLASLLDEFQKLERDDEEIREGMVRFETEAAKNVLALATTLIERSQSKLDRLVEESEPKVFVEDQEVKVNIGKSIELVK